MTACVGGHTLPDPLSDFQGFSILCKQISDNVIMSTTNEIKYLTSPGQNVEAESVLQVHEIQCLPLGSQKGRGLPKLPTASKMVYCP